MNLIRFHNSPPPLLVPAPAVAVGVSSSFLPIHRIDLEDNTSERTTTSLNGSRCHYETSQEQLEEVDPAKRVHNDCTGDYKGMADHDHDETDEDTEHDVDDETDGEDTEDDDDFNSDEEDDDDDDENSSIDHESERLFVKELVTAAFARTISNDDLKRFLYDDDHKEQQGPSRKKAKTFSTTPSTTTIVPEYSHGTDTVVVHSTTSPYSTSLCPVDATTAGGADAELGTLVPILPPCLQMMNIVTMKPSDYLRSLLPPSAVDSYFRTSQQLLEDGYFVDTLTDESICNYNDSNYLSLIHTQNIETLREALVRDDNNTTSIQMQQYQPMLCSNKFGETIMHLVCRRHYHHVLKFFLKEAKLSLRVICDNGRTPLHDACWTCQPITTTTSTNTATASTSNGTGSTRYLNFTCIDLLLNHCIDLLYCIDHKGYTPLDYVPKEYWHTWCTYLHQRGIDRLVPQSK